MSEHNYLGAAIFWLYIVAALFFSGLVIYTVLTLKTNTTPLSRDVAIFSTLACISFVTLSYNMLSVLIQSFFSRHQPYVAETVGFGSIWRWLICSTLFLDFGEAIVASPSRQYWTIAALIATMSNCLFMGAEGHRRGVPRLWAFFCVGQILPIGFTQNLFYLALLRVGSTTKQVAVRQNRVYMLLLVYHFVISFASTRSRYLLPAILVARVLLFVPLVIFGIQSEETDPRSTVVDHKSMQNTLLYNAMTALGLMLGQRRFQPSTDRVSLQSVWQALFEHPAVSSLGCDFIVSILSYGAWTSTLRTRQAAEAQGGTKTELLL